MEIILLTSQEIIEYSKEFDIRVILKDGECKSHFLNHNNMKFPLSLYLVEVTRKKQAEAVAIKALEEVQA
ncbi:hypothetical protein F6P74_05260 [Streptococcus suis]|uniref:hypothetical protein n=1 Tax=Streptococcus suis TaxID=1307 RepID=UPI000CF3763F|nr:hypothetical protein [Streptococcus suis]MBS8070940.1 hypothetical protein [Streptococcus suis]MBS8094085.1 hypothetical protein [Streptococcus suis]MBS8102667.1 hypothetical protein [Streptococcus suis]MBY4978196.1 hypothetical protein [Streptococcus suis]